MLDHEGKSCLKTVIFPIETKARDYQARLLLAVEFIRQGYDVVIGEREIIHRIIPAFKGAMVFEKGIGFTGENKISRLKRNGFTVVGWDDEGLVFDAKRYGFHNDRRVLALYDLFFAWGKNQKTEIQQHFGKCENVVITGNPRIDALTKLSNYKPPNKLTILFIDNFASVNHYEGGKRFNHELQTYVWAHPYKSDEDKSIQEKIMRNNRRSDSLLFQIFLEAIKQVAISFPDAALIVRPHPSSSDRIFETEFTSYPNVQIMREGAVEDYIVKSHAVVQSASTTAVQSFIIGAPIISLVNLDMANFGDPFPNQLGVSVTAIDELISEIYRIKKLEGIISIESRRGGFQLLKEHLGNVYMDDNGKIESRSTDSIVKTSIRLHDSRQLLGTASILSRIDRFFGQCIAWVGGRFLYRGGSSYSRSKAGVLSATELQTDLLSLGVQMPKVKALRFSGCRAFRISKQP